MSVVLRKCRICSKEAITVEDLEGFTKNNKSPYGRTTLCKPCGSIQSSKAPRHSRYKNVYGITADEYKRCMATATCCNKCGSIDSLCYDHDHNKKGIVAFRGVLCRQCNQAIGQLGDTEEGILQALQYLRRYNEQFN